MIYSVFEVTLVFEAATKKTDSGTKAKTEGLFTLATFFFFDRLHDPDLKVLFLRHKYKRETERGGGRKMPKFV